jgi:hypothetical protein
MPTTASNSGFVCAGIFAQFATVLVTRERDNLTPARWVRAFLHNTVSHGDPFCNAVLGVLSFPANERQQSQHQQQDSDRNQSSSSPGLVSGDWVASLNHTNQDHHNRQYQKNVNVPAQRVRTNNSQQPQHYQDHEDCPKHVGPRLSIIEVPLLICCNPPMRLQRAYEQNCKPVQPKVGCRTNLFSCLRA